MVGIAVQRSGAGGASKSLSNLADVAINTDLLPDAGSSRDLGTAAKMWWDLYVDNLVGPTVFNEAGADVDFRFEGLTNPNLLSLDAGLDAVGIGVVPIAGVRLALPLENDAATPTLAFGGGGDGLYSRTDSTLAFALQGTWSYSFATDNLSAVVSGGLHASLRRVNPTATVPSLVPSILTSSNTGIGLAAAGQLSLIAGGNESLRLTTTGVGSDVFVDDEFAIVIGHTTQITVGSTAKFQVLGTGGSDSAVIIGRWQDNAFAPKLSFAKSRGATIGSSVIVNDNDTVGLLRFCPDDGVGFTTLAAQFGADVDDASPAVGDIGMAFTWEQMDGEGGALGETMRLSASGILTVDQVESAGNITIGTEGGGTKRLAIKGSDATGGAEGGEIQLFLADDFDTTLANYVIDVFQDDLRFFGAGGSPQMTLTAEGYLVLGSGAKTTTGDPTGREGMIYWNTVDDRIRMFAEGVWRTLAFW